ncbi:MAG: riboflavin kinase, partial [Erysipelotrichales bacterium]
SIIGKVITGNQKGRTIGFPTANIRPIVNYRIPQVGVYATKVIYKGKEYIGMTNIGHNPTFNFSQTASIETNIIDFDEDIYGEEIEVVFYKAIRRERIFDGIDCLIEQLKSDREEIVNYFNS